MQLHLETPESVNRLSQQIPEGFYETASDPCDAEADSSFALVPPRKDINLGHDQKNDGKAHEILASVTSALTTREEIQEESENSAIASPIALSSYFRLLFAQEKVASFAADILILSCEADEMSEADIDWSDSSEPIDTSTVDFQESVSISEGSATDTEISPEITNSPQRSGEDFNSNYGRRLNEVVTSQQKDSAPASARGLQSPKFKAAQEFRQASKILGALADDNGLPSTISESKPTSKANDFKATITLTDAVKRRFVLPFRSYESWWVSRVIYKVTQLMRTFTLQNWSNLTSPLPRS
jgi:hypothetical protein